MVQVNAHYLLVYLRMCASLRLRVAVCVCANIVHNALLSLM